MSAEHDKEESSTETIIPSITVKEFGEEEKPSVKPLCIVKIEDLLSIPLIEETDNFSFKSKKIGLVMFGGKIESIFSDDSVFSFCVNDGTGKIRCFYRNRDCVESLAGKLNEFTNSAPDNVLFSDSDSENEDCDIETVFDNGCSKAFARESKDMITDVVLWCNKEVVAVAVAEERSKKVGDIVHVSGQLLESNSERKIKVMDFRIVENKLEHEDFLLETEYLYKNPH